MNLTIHLNSWTVPITVTVVSILLAAFVAAKEERGGDYSMPIMSMFAALAAVVASLTAWVVFIVLRFFG